MFLIIPSLSDLVFPSVSFTTETMAWASLVDIPISAKNIKTHVLVECSEYAWYAVYAGRKYKQGLSGRERGMLKDVKCLRGYATQVYKFGYV